MINGKDGVSRKSITVIALQFIQTALAAGTVIFLANLLNPQNYGLYVYYLTVSSIPPLFLGAGSEHVFLMYASKYHRLAPYLFGNAIFQRAVLTIAAILIGIICMICFDVENFYVSILIYIGSLIAVFSNPLFVSLYRVKGIHIRPWLLCLIGPIGFILYLFYIQNTKSLVLVSLGFFASNFLTFLVLLIDVRSMIRVKYSIRYLKKHLKEGMIFATSQVFDFAFSRVDIILIKFILGPSYLGVYAAGQRVINVFQLIPSSFHIVELPEFHRLHSNPTGLREKFINLRLVLIEIAAFIFGLLVLNSDFVIDLLFNKSYVGAVNIINLLSIASLLLFINYPYYMLAEAIGEISSRLKARIYTFLLTIASSIIFLNIYGVGGAAVGLIIGQITFLCLLHFITRKYNGGIVMLLKSLKSLFLMIIITLLVYFIPLGLKGISKVLFNVSVYSTLFIGGGILVGVLPSLKALSNSIIKRI